MAETHYLYNYRYILGNGILQTCAVGVSFVATASFVAQGVRFTWSTPVIQAQKGNPRYIYGGIVTAVDSRLEMTLPEIDLTALNTLKTPTAGGLLPQLQFRFVNYNGLYVRLFAGHLVNDANLNFSDMDFATTNIIIQAVKVPGYNIHTYGVDATLVPIRFL